MRREVGHADRKRRGRGVMSTAAATAVAVAAVAGGVADGVWRHLDGAAPAVHAQAPAIRLVSHVPGGGAATGDSLGVSIAADGSRLAFESTAPDLAGGDVDAVADVFAYDAAADRTDRVSLDAAGAETTGRAIMPALASGGGWVVFRSAAALTADPAPWGGLYLRELATGGVRLVVADTDGGRGASYAPAIAADGGRVAFESTAALAGAPADGRARVFVWDRSDASIRLVSPANADAAARDPAISDDGTTVAFTSEAANLVAGPAGGAAQVYAVDLAAPERLARVSVSSAAVPGDGASGEAALSGDGQVVAFASLAANLVDKDVNGVSDIFVHDRRTGTTVAVTDVTPADDVHHPGDSVDPDLSPSGRHLAFTSAMYTLTPRDSNWLPDVYVHDRQARVTRMVSRKASGAQSDDRSWGAAVADTGAVAFVSAAALAPGDAGAFSDVYLVGPGGDLHPHASPTPTVVHRPTWTPGHPTATAVHHPTATPGGQHPTATAVHHPTATPGGQHPTATAVHHPTATPGGHHPTATAVHHPTATPGGHHPTATAVHHPTATPDRHHPTATSGSPGGRVLPETGWRLWLPAVLALDG